MSASFGAVISSVQSPAEAGLIPGGDACPTADATGQRSAAPGGAMFHQ